jgi:hypothetical protein
LISEIDVPLRHPKGFQMGHQLPSEPLLDPLEFQWLAGDQTRTARIFWDEYNLSQALIKPGQAFVPVQSIYEFTTTPYNEIFVVGVHLMNATIEAGEIPLTIEAFTSGHRSWTMSWDNVFRVKTREDITSNIGRRRDDRVGLSVARELKLRLSLDEGGDYSHLITWLIRKLKLIPEEQALTQMFHCLSACPVQEDPIFIEYSLEVRLHESRYTTIRMGAFKLPWNREERTTQSQIQRLTKFW